MKNTDMRKYTVNLPVGMIESLTKDTGLGISEMLREALKEYERRWASKKLISLRGSIKLDKPYDWKELKKELRGEDRDLSKFLNPKS